MAMNTRGGLGLRVISVTAAVAFAIAMGPAAAAQDQEVPAWPRAMHGPDDRLTTVILQRVRATLASAFDSKLPPIPLDDWLFVTLAPAVDVVRTQFADWSVTFCEDRRSAIPGPGPELCAEATVPISNEKHVRIVIAVAGLGGNSTPGREWLLTRPSVRDVYIERLKGLAAVDSLDVPSLGDLVKLLPLPVDEWPAIEFDTRITWTPERPAPGDTVRFSFWVGNTGKRSASRASVQVLVAPCCDNTEVRRDWFPEIPAGRWVRLDVDAALPEAMAMALMHVTLGPSLKPARPSTRTEKDQVVSILPPWAR